MKHLTISNQASHIRSRKSVKVFALSAIFLAGFSYLTPANAHDSLVKSSPVSKSIVAVMPTKIWLQFDGNLIQLAGKDVNRIYLLDSRGNSIPILRTSVNGARILANIKRISLAGKITMSWRVVSEDGHPVSGSIYFYVKSKKS